ncbi:hypothetical protein KI387_015827, partial [Taxus chinensis]
VFVYTASCCRYKLPIYFQSLFISYGLAVLLKVPEERVWHLNSHSLYILELRNIRVSLKDYVARIR